MPHLYRTIDGTTWKAGQIVMLTLANGMKVQGTWAGSARGEILSWWLRKPGYTLAQTDNVSEIAIQADDDKEIIWGAAPARARLIFVLLEQKAGDDYQLAKMVTTASTAAQVLYFRHERFSLFGSLNLNGTIAKLPPLDPPPAAGSKQGQLF